VRRLAFLVAALLVLPGCEWPRDAGTTLHDVRGGVLRVGVTAEPPWTTVAADGTVGGAETVLVERLAARLGARIEWYPGSESTRMAALKERVLDLVVGGLTADAPWIEQASLTRPYVTTRPVVAVPTGAAVPKSLDGQHVAVRAGSAELAALRDEGAKPDAVADLRTVAGPEPRLVEEWQCAPLGLRPTKHTLDKHEHVVAVPLGENAWQVEVEDFLLDVSRAEILALLTAADAPAGAGR
jgi:polar amino acid transport system substrate-binding protein